MKVSMSLPAEDVELLDDYVREGQYRSRSAALRQAVMLLRSGQLASAYEDAWQDWADTPEAQAWETVAADGLES